MSQEPETRPEWEQTELHPQEMYEHLDYPWIRAWGRLCGFTATATEAMLARARRDAAPGDALIWSSLGDGQGLPADEHPTERWITLVDVTDPESRIWLVDYAQSRDLPVPYAAIRAWIDPLRQ